MIRRHPHFGSALAVALLAAAALWLFLSRAGADLSTIGQAVSGYDPARMVLLYSTLPRLATALLCGAALSLSGVLLQQVLRNSLASPTTLGLSAGGNLALALASLFLPSLIGFGRDLVALAGSALAAGFVFFLGARRGFAPISLVLSGLVVSLWCGALTAMLILTNERYLASLFIWGSGSLSQQSWQVAAWLLPKVAVLAVCAAFLVRPLTLLDLGDRSAAALGLGIRRLRVLALAVAVGLSALVTSAVGVIGFIGLVAPIAVRLLGARGLGAQLFWAPLLGAALLLLADEGVQWMAGAMAEFLPTGAVTAIFGSPLLLVLLPFLKARHRPPAEAARPAARLPLPQQATAGLLVALFVFVLAIALLLGRTVEGSWEILPVADWQSILPFRLPRILGALAAGAMLAASGMILQRLTGNEMASPELLGINAGATIGVVLALLLLAAPGQDILTGFAALGAFAVMLAVVLFGLRSGFAPERVLLAGIALGAMADAITGVLAAMGDPRAILLVRWISGATSSIDMRMAAVLLLAAVVLLPAGGLARRWLGVLPLGPTASRAIGLPLSVSRLGLFALAAFLAAVATVATGPLSFVGLMAPHIARELGLRRAMPQLAGAAACGGALLVFADWLGRVAIHPYQLPAGLISALVGAPFLMLLLRRRA